LEIGTHAGISTAALLAGVEANGGHVWSVDVHAGSRYTHWGHPQWKFVQSDSKNTVELGKILPASFDLVFIDGDHSYEGCAADLENWGRKGKVVLVHDSDTPAFTGVRRAIDEFCDRYNFLHELRAGSNGLEVIFVQGRPS
jgi:predicted O-methyltransferase YrrM